MYFLLGTAIVLTLLRRDDCKLFARLSFYASGVIDREFVRSGYVQRIRDRLRRLKQTGSVSEYLSEFRKIIITLPGVTEGEKLDKFIRDLKHNARLEGLKSTASTFEDASSIAL